MPAQILFVSNEPLMEKVNLSAFRKEIKANEYQFTFASNGREALEKVHSNPEIQLTIVNMIPERRLSDILPNDHKISGI